eukprot:4426137-Prymnesium_polylepis.1
MASFGGSLHARLVDWTAPASGGERVSRPPRSDGVAVPGAIARDSRFAETRRFADRATRDVLHAPTRDKKSDNGFHLLSSHPKRNEGLSSRR